MDRVGIDKDAEFLSRGIEVAIWYLGGVLDVKGIEDLHTGSGTKVSR